MVAMCTAGMRAVALAPDRSEGVVALTNGDTPIDDVAMHAIGAKVPVMTPATFSGVSMEPARLDQYVGTFAMNAGTGATPPYVITRGGDRIFGRLASQPKFRMYPTEKPRWHPTSAIMLQATR
jgi:hypothetical protein